jgi:hypothetical protein
VHNDEVDWDRFVSDTYWADNYRCLRADDRSILATVGAFFTRHFAGRPAAAGLHGVDIGTGTNLYPALGMLPWCRTVTLVDPSRPNLRWLAGQLAAPDGPAPDGPAPDNPVWPWQPFWDVYRAHAAYRRVPDPRRRLAEVCRIRRAGVLDLEPAAWDVGTMFFVAESMTEDSAEFERATAAFLGALRPGAPFAAAFMAGSLGYLVGESRFPAVRDVDAARVAALLERCGATVSVSTVPVPHGAPLRDGYEGMIVAVGTTSSG